MNKTRSCRICTKPGKGSYVLHKNRTSSEPAFQKIMMGINRAEHEYSQGPLVATNASANYGVLIHWPHNSVKIEDSARWTVRD